MSWTEEKVAKLKELWGKGNTASQIAEIIGGISRNAVIGKAHRLNLSAKIKTRNAPTTKNLFTSLMYKLVAPTQFIKPNFLTPSLYLFCNSTISDNSFSFF